MRLIDADALGEKVVPYTLERGCVIGRHSGIADAVLKLIDDAPTIDAEPVRHGRWEAVTESVWNLQTPVLQGWRCSLCGRYEPQKEPYCHCGAKMDGGADNAEND